MQAVLNERDLQVGFLLSHNLLAAGSNDQIGINRNRHKLIRRNSQTTMKRTVRYIDSGKRKMVSYMIKTEAEYLASPVFVL